MKNENEMLLTQSQLLMWAGQKLSPEAPLYNMAHTFTISGEINVNRFRGAFQKLVEQVDALRTVFYEKDTIPYQSIKNKVDYTFDIVEYSTGIEDGKLKDWITERSQKKIDIGTCVFDSALIKISEEKHTWFLNMHHLVTDATSFAILYDLMCNIYKNDEEITEIIGSYTEYISFESKIFLDDNKDKQRTYWKTKIEDVALPTLYGNKRENETTKSKRVTLKLGEDRSKKLKELANSTAVRSWTQDLTLFNIFSSILFIYLNKVSGQQRLSIGTPFQNRTTKSFKKIPGLFIEILPLVLEIEDGASFLEILNKTKLETNGYLQNSHAGMATSAISKSYNVILNYINTNFSDFNGLAMESEWIHPGHCDPSHQLRCHIYDMDASGEITVLFDINEDTFNHHIQQEIPKHFLNVLDACIEDIHQTAGAVNLLSENTVPTLPSEEEALTSAFEPIVTLFEKKVVSNPQRVALDYNGEEITYATLNKKANQLATYLNETGINSGDKVAVYLHRTPEYIISLLAILKTGATFIPIPSNYPVQRVSYILEDAVCSLIITNSGLQSKIEYEHTDVLDIEDKTQIITTYSADRLVNNIDNEAPAYMIYTSGSTGNPKGVFIPQKAVSNYINWSNEAYKTTTPSIFPLFTSIGFDLTITSTFLPLIQGGKIVIYKESDSGPDISIMRVLDENKVNSIKLTPSHLTLLKGMDLSSSKIDTMIVGGEDFKTYLARDTQEAFGKTLQIFNEYGPTEATVGCIVEQFDAKKDTISVPIGKPITRMHAYILDMYKNQVPQGVTGDLYIAGIGLASGYANLPELTETKFIDNPFVPGTKMYHTGDLARWNTSGTLEYLGRIDEQVKLRGYRIELPDIESNLANYPAVEHSAVVLVENKKAVPENEVINCTKCGLPSNYPNTDFDADGVCHVCNAFEGYKDEAQRYFKTEDELKTILTSKRGQHPHYDCLSLLSGGKDSTYILAQLVGMGLKVLAFTLDNGYISKQAKVNIDRIVAKLGVDHVYGTTEHMNKIFVDSLHRHHNVCDGCFKTIYTLSTKIALEKEIPFIVTGLSRGQFFETRLTEELFWDDKVDVETIDKTILQARKLYHQEEDAVKTLLDISVFDKDETFEKVQFIDFYRYSDVSLEEMLRYLKEKVDWVRPTDTGRSTNCLINQVGIYTHKKQKGYSNYSFPYSWDVRMGHKTRSETLEEINEVIDEKEVKRIMKEIGYVEPSESELEQQRLVGYYTAEEKINAQELASYLNQELPEYMIPTHFKHVKELPLTPNGKVDKAALKKLNFKQLETDIPFIAPEGELEELVADIWKGVLRLDQISVKDNFIALGGHSLAAIQATARLNKELGVTFELNKIFEFPTITSYALYVEQTLTKLLEEEYNNG